MYKFFERLIIMNTTLKKTAYIVTFFALASVFALIYYAGYYYATRNNFGFNNLITKEDVTNANPGMKAYDDTLNVAANENPIITTSTKYIEECYDQDTGELTKTESDMPIVLLGLDREAVIDYLTTYKATNVGTGDNVLNIQLVSFSAEQVVIRKTIRDIDEIYNYYVVSEDSIIKIYHSDQTTLFADTGIDISNIDEEYKKDLENGFYIETIHELYNYLESITS